MPRNRASKIDIQGDPKPTQKVIDMDHGDVFQLTKNTVVYDDVKGSPVVVEKGTLLMLICGGIAEVASDLCVDIRNSNIYRMRDTSAKFINAPCRQCDIQISVSPI